VTISFTRTREQLQAMVLRKLGVPARDGSATASDANIIYEAIDLRLKEMHRLGIFWRKVVSVPAIFSVTANVSSAQFATNDIVFPIALTVMDSSMDEPVRLISIPEYAAILNKGETGLPTRALWKGSTEFMLHPIPTVASTLKLVYEKYADDTSAGAGIDVEVSMLRWMKDIIAADIGDDFGIDEVRMTRFAREAVQAEKNIRKLAVQVRTDYKPVAVDDWGGPLYRRESDYDR
jgi:hypothetical protein